MRKSGCGAQKPTLPLMSSTSGEHRGDSAGMKLAEYRAMWTLDKIRIETAHVEGQARFRAASLEGRTVPERSSEALT